MNPAQHYRVIDHLKDGTEVIFRAVRPDDKELIKEAFRNLEPETIYTRYFYHKTYLSDADLKWATELDFVNDVAIVVTIFQDETEVVIGGSRYSLLRGQPGSPQRAEIAFTVEEDYQGLGMGKLLLKHMTSIARGQNLTGFEAEVLSQNGAMITVFEKSGLQVRKRHEGGSIHVTMDFPEVRSDGEI